MIRLLKQKVDALTERARKAEAAIQRVWDWLDNAGFPLDTESPYGQGYHHAMNDTRRAIDGGAE